MKKGKKREKRKRNKDRKETGERKEEGRKEGRPRSHPGRYWTSSRGSEFEQMALFLKSFCFLLLSSSLFYPWAQPLITRSLSQVNYRPKTMVRGAPASLYSQLPDTTEIQFAREMTEMHSEVRHRRTFTTYCVQTSWNSPQALVLSQQNVRNILETWKFPFVFTALNEEQKKKFPLIDSYKTLKTTRLCSVFLHYWLTGSPQVHHEHLMHYFVLSPLRVSTKRAAGGASPRVSTLSSQKPPRPSLLKQLLSCRARWASLTATCADIITTRA